MKLHESFRRLHQGRYPKAVALVPATARPQAAATRARRPAAAAA